MALVGFELQGFGEANPPLNLLVSVLENRNPPPTDWTFSLNQNRASVGWFGRVVELRSSLDSLNMIYKLIFCA